MPERLPPAKASPARLAAQWLARLRLASLLLQRGGLSDGVQAWPGFDDWCQANPGRSCVLSVSSWLLHELVCEADLPLADDAAALAWARPLLLHYHGDAAQAWPLAAWQDGPTRGVSVLHGARLDALAASAARHGVRLLAVRPWWARVLHLALQREPALRRGPARLLVVEGACLTLVQLRDGRLEDLQIRRLASATPQALRAWCDEATPAWSAPARVIGYGLAAGPLHALPTAGPLDAPAPGRAWLSGTAP